MNKPTDAIETSLSKNSKVVFNPYAKTKTTSISITNININKITSITATQKLPSEKPQSNQETISLKGRQTSLIVGPSSTFSQVFGDHDPDACFGEKERAEQRAFDENLVSNSTEQTNELTARDNHKFLQPHVLHVSTRQRGNPILAHVRNVPFHFSQMVPDYIFAPTRCALFLSLRYHNLHPNYVHRRIAELKSDFELRVLLCQVDVDDNASVLLFLNDLCVHNALTLILAWSEEEAARYLETFKAFDGKDASLIQKREHTNYIDQVNHALGSVPAINKTDSSQLLTQFGTWRNLVCASVEELSICPGVGVKKVRRLYEAFRRPFSKEAAKRRKINASSVNVEKQSSVTVGEEKSEIIVKDESAQSEGDSMHNVDNETQLDKTV